ncbi:MAG TPA: DUF3090 family protein, partial [Acidimicrobiales bacterium]
MTEAYDLSAERLCVGTVGPVGSRLFLLQCREGDTVLTLKMEKLQVAAMAGTLAQVIKDEQRPGHLPDDQPLEEPAEPAWAVGTIGVSFDEAEDRVVLVIEELVPEGEVGA